MWGLNDPSALLRPWKDLRQFSEELFAMFSSKAPVEREGPVVIRVKRGQTGLAIKRMDEPPAPTATARDRARDAAVSLPGPRQDVPARRDDAAPRRADPAAPEARTDRTPAAPATPPPPGRKREAPLFSVDGPVEFTGSPARFERPPQVWDRKRRAWYTPRAWEFPDDLPTALPGGSGGGTSAFIGKVVSGSGDTYQVALYPDGTAADAGDTVEVTVPTIDPDETIDAGTWLSPVLQFTDADGNDTYECQPPVWMD